MKMKSSERGMLRSDFFLAHYGGPSMRRLNNILHIRNNIETIDLTVTLFFQLKPENREVLKKLVQDAREELEASKFRLQQQTWNQKDLVRHGEKVGEFRHFLHQEIGIWLNIFTFLESIARK